MILTGKAKEAFLNHLYFTEDTSQVNESIENEILEESSCWLSNQDERFRHALIIEWLDSVGIYVSVEPSIPIGWENPDCFIFRVCTDTNRLKFPNRQQATEKAIEKANEIYNKRGN